MNLLKYLDSSMISKIEFYDPSGYFTVTGKKDMNLIIHMLQSMQLTRTLPNLKDGYAFKIKIYDVNLSCIEIIVRSNDIVINSKFYQSDRNYCEDFRNLYHLLADN